MLNAWHLVFSRNPGGLAVGVHRGILAYYRPVNCFVFLSIPTPIYCIVLKQTIHITVAVTVLG